MIAFADARCFMPCLDRLHARFLALLPRIERHARVYFRHVRCPQRREDCVQEAVALAWKWFVRLAERGKDAGGFVRTLATLAARSVRSGRRVCGQEKAGDVMSPLTQRRHGFAVQQLPGPRALAGTPAGEALRENTRTEVPAQVAFRLDFTAWRTALTDRDRRMSDELMVGERTKDVARRFGLSPARVSQKRRAFRDGWAAFCGERAGDGKR